MNNQDPESSAATRVCAKCARPSDEAELARTEYRCPGCGFEMAHVDLLPNGTIRSVFGYLKTVGEVIQDRYRVQQVLGKGGFGATYLVEDLRLKGKRRALKEIPQALFDEHEVNLLCQLIHPAIPDLIDRFVGDGMIYLVLEFGGTRTLGTECRSRGGKVPLAALLPWLEQLCDALIYLHSQDPPIIHRDLKPDNILLDDTNRIMLIDFGIAKESAPATTTRLMARAASHGFSPPEQVMQTGTDQRSDIYALAATCYYLLTGQVPAPAHERVAGTELAAPSALVPGLPAEIDDLLSAALDLNINRRPASVAEVKRRFDALSRAPAAEFAATARTLRFDPGGPNFATASPSAPVPGIRITTGERIAPKSEGVAPKRRLEPWVLAGLGLLALALLAGTAWTLHRRFQHLQPPPALEASAPASGQTPAGATPTVSSPASTVTTPASEPPPAAETARSEPGAAQPPAAAPIVAPPVVPQEQSAPSAAVPPSAPEPATAEASRPVEDAPPTPATPQAATSTPAPAPSVPAMAAPVTPPPPTETSAAPAAPVPSSSAMEALTGARPEASRPAEPSVATAPQPTPKPAPKPKPKKEVAKTARPNEPEASGFQMIYKGTRKTD